MIILDGIIFKLQQSGGISNCFAELLKRMAASQLSYSLFSYGNNSVFDPLVMPHNAVRSPLNSYLPIKIDRYLDVVISREASVFHSSYYRLPLRKSDVRIITTVHDFTYERYGSGLSKFVHHQQKKRAILNSDVVICISESTKRDLFEFIPEAHSLDVRVVLNGVSEDYFRLGSLSAPQKDYVLYVGARKGYKNFMGLVDALRSIPELDLISVGGGAFSYDEETYLERALPGRYHHIEFASNVRLNELYNSAFCLVYPSLYEGFGLPVLEAMRAGCPVVAANSSSLPEVCGDAAILLDQVNSESIACAIKSLFENSLRSSLINLGLIQAKNFSWDENVRQILNIYKETEGALR